MKGAALIPKLGVDVMTCEVIRLMLLTKSSIIPLSYHVPRKVSQMALNLISTGNSVTYGRINVPIRLRSP